MGNLGKYIALNAAFNNSNNNNNNNNNNKISYGIYIFHYY